MSAENDRMKREMLGAYASAEPFDDEPRTNVRAVAMPGDIPDDILFIAECRKHGLHGQRKTCFCCGEPVIQVPMRRCEQPAPPYPPVDQKSDSKETR